jgi:hypothetical protein
MTIETNRIMLVSTNAKSVTFAVNGANRQLSWDDLRNAAREPIYGVGGLHGGQPDDELRDIYATLLREAADSLRELPRREQGIEVRVLSRTGGASWVAEVYDAANTYRRDLMLADEGVDEPHQRMAAITGQGIGTRIGAPVRVVPI